MHCLAFPLHLASCEPYVFSTHVFPSFSAGLCLEGVLVQFVWHMCDALEKFTEP